MFSVDDMELRVLMHSGSRDDSGAEDGEGPSSTLDLRIAAVFIVFAAGMLGCLPPLFMKAFTSSSHPAPRIVRALGAGVILALALIHIIPESVTELEALSEHMDRPYNVAGCTVVLGVLFMVLLDFVIHSAVDKQEHRPTLPAVSPKQPVAEALETITTRYDPHTHVCVGHQSALILDVVAARTRRDQALACLFELGCVFHSLIIGLALGVETSDMAGVRALTIALAFHQLLEGLALSSFIARAQLSRVSGFLMVLGYSLTCPLGIAIGIVVADTYNPESTTAIAVQGVFNGLSGGMLLHIALVHIIVEDFSRRELPVDLNPAVDMAHNPDVVSADVHVLDKSPSSDKQGWVMFSSLTALFVGAGLMALLAIWA